MIYLAMIPFFVQTLVIGLDEFYFHVRRGLPRWERLGHPLDTLTVLACFLFVLCIPYSSLAMKFYIGLAVFSCVFVTKDEFVHKECCPASEQWLHALLFLNHPVVLSAAGILWYNMNNFIHQFLLVQAVFISLFLSYQVIYWNFIYKEPQSDQ